MNTRHGQMVKGSDGLERDLIAQESLGTVYSKHPGRWMKCERTVN
jgi:hypothetical protein